jgi:LytS/YehU family sensor histidine kinase
MIVRRRPHNLRFLSEDATLLASLAEVFSFLLENLRLREKRLAQEQREGELILNAHRSELKALRAQINPHFLFNALNTIAGLIPRNPERAERTIEQLAEVFRYTLRRSDREWVRLDDELAAVRAYLDIEQTRFPERLRVVVNTSEGARNWRIPAMTVQTLVENAVKHGVAKIAGPALVEIQAEVAGCRLRIEVRDNGPGFSLTAGSAACGKVAGYGLRNVRERLAGHFGGHASLEIEREAARGLTVVRMEMPEARA